VMEMVVDKFLRELQERLDKQKVKLEVTASAKKWLAEHGHDPRFGARPLGRLIENEIARTLADEVLFGKLTKGGIAKVDLDDDKLSFAYEPTASKQPAPVA
jgi:ATP-dependent Clp protease ATP-binding subunit ClpA